MRRLPSKPTFQVLFLFKKKSCCSQSSWSSLVFLTKSLLYKSGPVRARGSHFLLGYRLSTLALSQFQFDEFHRTVFFSDHKTPKYNLSGPFLRRDIQRKTSQKVIDSSDFLLFPLWHKSGPEKGGVLVQRTTLDPKFILSADRKAQQNHTTQRAGQVPASAAIIPQSPGRFSPLLPLSVSLPLSLSLSPAVQSQRWRCCVTGKGADPDQPPLPLHCSHTH